ncbi:MAG: hypothetical protein KKC01_10245 [Gammaproteobacteria bacterium]|nr:hypothetical protein [Gammaproteobacteria bacterium]
MYAKQFAGIGVSLTYTLAKQPGASRQAIIKAIGQRPRQQQGHHGHQEKAHEIDRFTLHSGKHQNVCSIWSLVSAVCC